MALFSKEADKTVSRATPQNPAASTSPLASGGSARTNGAVQADTRALLDRGSKVTGKVAFEGAARLDGEIDGELSGKDLLVIGEYGIITAQIRATSVTVAGKVTGDIIATQRIELRPSAKVQGNLIAPVLVIQEGAQFEGHCSMRAEAPRDERKVTAFPKEERLAQAAPVHKPA